MNEEGFITFACEHCRIAIEASPDMVGTETECPACGQKLRVPGDRGDGVTRHGADEPSPAAVNAEKRRTIRIELDSI